MKPLGTQDGQSLAAAPNEEKTGATEGLLEQVLDPENLRLALARVKANKGAAGVDGMQVGELDQYLTEQWDSIRAKLLAGTYKPAPVRRVEIPKPDGGVRLLGVPTALNRLLQQMLHQVLSPIFDPGFSDSSYGFRPLRSAHQAVVRAKAHIDEGYGWMVEVDAEKYFDRVNHDVLMARVERKVKDRRVLRLIRRFLRSGVMVNGIVQETPIGTPQGGPLSPLLANILLDDLDKELEQRGHRFVRYADDITVFVRSRKAGERVLQSLRRYLDERLRIKVNVQKSHV
ncbi:MAG: group II intron reverse transcriptase/maturase, partial [Thermaerobacter sp.]|nr:group II intron reverse transcriptase/maturase [Thermaerobacter sp.]